ncbi:hypothetical protein CFOL_v3_20314 [Cephalotus follicularis]|uniref:Uncharacterized protein n=1 Tax=Cephalotus follicularis TaxID=3775 RepID=A0A1Q3C9T6_CEPFO|nr:hypothetical protein CFOL_v3_20314 [Cephalotus follicularis]
MSFPISSSNLRVSPSRENTSSFVRDFEVNVVPLRPQLRCNLLVVYSSESEDKEDRLPITSIMEKANNNVVLLANRYRELCMILTDKEIEMIKLCETLPERETDLERVSAKNVRVSVENLALTKKSADVEEA